MAKYSFNSKNSKEVINITEAKSLEEADTRKIHVPTIQERIRDQALMQSEAIDEWLDVWFTDRKKFDPKGFDFKGHFQRTGVTQAHARKIKSFFENEIADFKGSIESLKKDKNPFTQVADLSKVIPGVIQGAVQDAAFGAIASKVGGVGGLALGSLASDAVGGISAAAAGGYGQTSLQAGLAAGQKATDAVTASRAANEKIASVSGAAKSKASSLLGGPI